ncbi:MAG: 16S rRNA (adenine(1518)-N(6)/adenine(1519)-N(6))-dimethyltransferase RsmA [Alphaproteobacteria bacterium]|nr:16S rRNA (adenine(1518)-N(6)/adenine(1519)-N(6))-dimethyltransferase RsmA [Alphaproteobacteria bacterium]
MKDTLPPLRDVIREHGLTPRKGLGQHFLLDLNLTARIARVAGDISGGTTIEVGPGPGGLTRALLDEGATVLAIEKDERCLDALADVSAAWPGKLEILKCDALKLDASTLGETPRRVIANLPYNIGTELLVRWLNKPEAFTSLTVMIQKEVAERIAAGPGSKIYGRLSVLAGWRWKVTRALDVPPEAFTPPPKVESTVIHAVPLEQPVADADAATLTQVTAATFGQRRKMLRSSLKTLGDAQALCAAADLDPTLRPEQVSVAGFCALARAVAAQ